ncbi:MAG: 2-oxo acid dehydrogenase subunit E2 [Eubacterium sp.]|nr:2-oxo acid dehydrogenase subunit E2 [Eubacterium sp.]
MAIYKKEYFGIARKIVSNMTVESWEQIPHAAFGYEADVTEFLEELKKVNADAKDKSEKVTINTAVMKVICEGLKEAPKMNCTLDFRRKLVRGTLNYHDNIDVSMPVILNSGLMMTVNLHDIGNKSLSEMTTQINETVRRANNSDMDETMYQVSLNYTLEGLKKGNIIGALNKLFGSKVPGPHRVKNLKGEKKKAYYAIPVEDRFTRHDIEQGTTTITNLGSIYRKHKGMSFLIEIIPPQTTAFSIDAVQRRPVVTVDENGNEKIEIRSILPITVAIDHRALDYGDCVPFFEKLDEIFDNPSVIQNWK